MSLKVAHINREAPKPDPAIELWEQVLQPKWEAKILEEAKKKFPGVDFEQNELNPTA